MAEWPPDQTRQQSTLCSLLVSKGSKDETRYIDERDEEEEMGEQKKERMTAGRCG